jgi:hypothetical protein
MSGAGVDNLGHGVRNHGDRFPRRRIGEAKKNDFGLIQKLLSASRVFPSFRLNLEEFDILPLGKMIPDLESRSAFLPVHKHLKSHKSSRPKSNSLPPQDLQPKTTVPKL